MPPEAGFGRVKRPGFTLVVLGRRWLTEAFSAASPFRELVMSQTNWAHFIAMQAGVVPYSEDDPGWAKTAAHRALAEATGRRFIQVILGQCLREDIGGVPVPETLVIGGVERRCVVPLLNEAMERARHEPCVLLLDELNQTTHDVLGAAQEWINNPPADCWMAACGNPPERSTSGMELSAPVVNRMCCLKWERFDDERREGWKSGFAKYPSPDMPIVPVDFLTDFGPKWGNLLCQFEEHRPEHFGSATFPEDPSEASKPWRSGRSWSNLGILMAACEAVGGSKSTAAKLATGCVGYGPSMEFLAWIDQQDLPDPRFLLQHPQSLKLPRRFDLAQAIVRSVLGIVKQSPEGYVWEQGYDVLEQVFTQNREVALSAHGAFWKAKPVNYEPKHRSGVALELQEKTMATA